MGKRAVAKVKAKAKGGYQVPDPEPEEESAEKLEAKRLWQQRKEASKWVKAQLDLVRAQQEVAKKRGNCDWLLIAHEYHEIRLIRAAKRLDEKTLDGVPHELREGVEAYLSQCARGADVEQSSFREDIEIWDLLPREEGADTYQRVAASPEVEAAAKRIASWADASPQGALSLVKVMHEFAESPLVQEAGLVRIGGLYAEAREDGQSPMLGLTVENLMPAIEKGMKTYLEDPEVQRSGCAALRGMAMAEGQLPALCDVGGVHLVVEATRTHYKNKDVVSAANGAFWAMAKASSKNSPELAIMREAGVVEVLLKCMDHHAWDQTLVGRIRVTLPFIKED